MKKRIAIEYFGQLRQWELNVSTGRLVSFLTNRGYDVDVFGTFWDDDYTHSQIELDRFKEFQALLLVEEPELLYEDRNPTLKKYFYSLQNSNELRRAYRSKHKLKYELVLMLRPDINFKIDSDKFDKTLKLVENIGGKPCMFIDQNTIGTIPVDDDHNYEKIEDKFIILNEAGADYISEGYKKLDYFRYHTGLKHAADKLIGYTEKIDGFLKVELIRHDIINPYKAKGWDDGYFDDEIGFVRRYLKYIQDSDVLKSEVDRLYNKLLNKHPDITVEEAIKINGRENG